MSIFYTYSSSIILIPFVGGSTNPEIDFGVRKLTNKMNGGRWKKVSYSLWGIVKPQEIKKGAKREKTFLGAKKKGLWEFLYLFHIKHIATMLKYMVI